MAFALEHGEGVTAGIERIAREEARAALGRGGGCGSLRARGACARRGPRGAGGTTHGLSQRVGSL
jgi:hypothetical protein